MSDEAYSEIILMDGPPVPNELENLKNLSSSDILEVGTEAPDLAGVYTQDILHPRKYRISYIYNPKKLNLTDDVIASEIRLSENWVTFVNDKSAILAVFRAELIQRIERISME